MILLLWLACMLVPGESGSRCRDLQIEVGRCLGVDSLPLECEQLSSSDVESFETVLETAGCSGLQALVPLDGDPLAASCALIDQGCADRSIPEHRVQGTLYPVVLVNGIDVSPLFSWSERIVEVLEDADQDVHLAVVPPFDDTVSRSRVLWRRIQEIKEDAGAEKVNLICHSLGGLDCRYLVSPAGLHLDVDASHVEIVSSVASVTTVATAHYGTPVADVALGYISGEDPDDAIDALATTFGAWFSGDTLDSDVDLRRAIGALTESQALSFNAEIVDAEGVYYQSWAGFSRPFGEPWPDPDLLQERCRRSDGTDGLGLYSGLEDHLALPLLPSYGIVGGVDAVEGVDFEPNDGLCPVRSAAWGEFKGCVPVDHQEQLGRGNLPDTNVRNHIDVAW